MRDHAPNCSELDGLRINLSQAHAVSYWTRKFQISPEELASAIKAVGNRVFELKGYLSRSRPALAAPRCGIRLHTQLSSGLAH